MALIASEIIASVRATLDYPDYGRLKQQLVVLKLREKVDHYFNRMNLTDRNWFLNSVLLTTNANEDSYLISEPDWGRPILCETIDSSDPQHVRAVVPIVDLQDRQMFYEGTVADQSGSTVSSKHSAACVSLYKSPEGESYVKFTPAPSQGADYLLTYEPNRALPIAFSSNLVFLDQFQNLLVADLALTLLPYCGWEELVIDQASNRYRVRTKADELRDGLMRDYQVYAVTFEEYIQQDRQAKVEVKHMWGDSINLQGDGWY